MSDIINQGKKPAPVKDMHPMVSYEDAQKIIYKNLVAASENFISIGYYLKLIRDNEMYQEGGFSDIWEFAKNTYGIGKSVTSRWMSMNDKYSVDGNSPYLQEKFKGFGKSQLQEMLYLTDDQMEQVDEKMTVKEIRDIRRSESVEEKVVEPEPSLTEPVATSQLEETCDGKCFNCKSESCNGEQNPREHCVLDKSYPCTSIHIFDQLKADFPDIYEKCIGCCRSCSQRNICGYACNRPDLIQKKKEREVEQRNDYPEMKTIEEELHVEQVEGEIVDADYHGQSDADAVATSQQGYNLEYSVIPLRDKLFRETNELDSYLAVDGLPERLILEQKMVVDGLKMLYEQMIGDDGIEED